MKFIRDEDLKLAFVTMLNKLVFGHKLILKPYLLALLQFIDRQQYSADSAASASD